MSCVEKRRDLTTARIGWPVVAPHLISEAQIPHQGEYCLDTWAMIQNLSDHAIPSYSCNTYTICKDFFLIWLQLRHLLERPSLLQWFRIGHNRSHLVCLICSGLMHVFTSAMNNVYA